MVIERVMSNGSRKREPLSGDLTQTGDFFFESVVSFYAKLEYIYFYFYSDT